AEDGVRFCHVTGVQTCALPIYPDLRRRRGQRRHRAGPPLRDHPCPADRRRAQRGARAHHRPTRVEAPFRRSRAMTDEFTGKVVLVTGATRGLGYAIARGFAAAGATVVVSSRKQDACERAAEAITSETGVRADALAFHVGRWDTITPAVDEVYSRHGRLDVV